jgi:hypothetical protein
MADLRIEIAVVFSHMPTEGLRVEIVARTRDHGRQIRTWNFFDAPLDTAQLEEFLAVLSAAVTDQFVLTPGVQLVLHD